MPEVEPDDNARHPVHLRQREGPQGGPADAPQPQLEHRRRHRTIFGITPDDVILSNLPLFHVFGHNINFWLPLLVGMTAVTYANPLEYRTHLPASCARRR